MTAPTTPFDLRTAKAIAADLITNDQGTADTIEQLDQLHTRIFTALGDTADAVAAKLAEFGIKGALPEVVQDGAEIYGDLTDDEGNALAVLLRDVCGAHSASVFTTGAIVCWAADNGEELAHEDIELPEVLRKFQTEYEDFRYPDLYTGPVPQIVTDYQSDDRTGIERFEHTARGPVREVTDRREHSVPMPDDLIAAIGAAGLTVDDYADQVHLNRDGNPWAIVHGSDNGGRYSLWSGEYGYLPDQMPTQVYQGLKTFTDRDEAVRYVLANVDTPRLVAEKRDDGRWQHGPLTNDSQFVRIATDTLLAAMAGGVTLDQLGGPLNPVDVFRGGERVATVGLVGLAGGNHGCEAELTDGRTLTAPNMDDALTATFEALNPA